MGQLKSKAIRHRLPIRASLQINAVQERFLDFARNDDTREMLDSSIPTNSTKREHFLIPNP
ncbi:MAG: hypothetical protein EGR19_09330 [Dialister sp.]|nr:hypothetical protein [Dialister sp.]MBD9032380.1 hypothetical protein [Dialister sp.]HAD77978.1 hypothetical protein [Dialister sp.]